MAEDLDDSDVSASDEEPHEAAIADGDPKLGGSNGNLLAAAAANVQEPSAALTAADRAAEAALLAGEITSDTAVLQLQINDLLGDVRPSPSKETAVTGVIGQLRSVLAGTKPHEVSGTLLPGFVRDLGLVPEEVTLTFEPPSAIEAVGSHPLHCCLGATTRGLLDVVVVMPSGCLHKKDHLNYRYHARRVLYLAVLSRKLARHPQFQDQQWEAIRGDPARPALLVKVPLAPTAAGATRSLMLRLMAVPAMDVFPLHKLSPDRNNIRWVTKDGTGKSGQQQQQQQQQVASTSSAGQPSDWLATPQYNAGILADILAVSQAKALAAKMQASAHLRDALLLLKVWAKQTGLSGSSSSTGRTSSADMVFQSGGCDGFSGHLLAGILLVSAERTGPTAAVMSAYQLFRAALKLMGDAAAWGRGLAMAQQQPCQQQQQQQQAPPTLQVFKKAYSVVLVDPSGWLNLAAGVSQSLLQQGHVMARRTLAALDNPADAEGAFAAAFLSPVRPAALFDYCWAVTLPAPAGDSNQEPLGDVSSARQVEANIESMVRKALTTRAVLVRCLPRPLVFPQAKAGETAVAALAAGAATPQSQTVLVGAVVDAQEAMRVVDVGPAADDTAAAARFRALWGDKSDLRRFQDGKICEAVVWDAPPDARHTIPDAAVAYLLRRHLAQGAHVEGTASRLDGALQLTGQGPAGMGAVTASRAAEGALDKLSKQLRALGDVVLKVVGVQPVSAVSRHTAAFVPEPHPLAGGPGGLAAAAGAAHLPRCLDPLEVMVQLEGSGRWPDDLTAYSKMKAAVGCQLAAALQESAGFSVSPSEEAVDVFVDGIAFRLLVYTDRDAAMHAKAAAAGPHAHHHHAAAHSPPRVLVLSWHHGLVATLDGQHAAFGPTCRLAKRWLGCQLMGSQLCGEAVELLVGAAFCGPATMRPPASRIAGLLRFLQVLSTHPWQRTPLLVDPLKEVGQAQRRAMLHEYEARRDVGSAPAMYISTPRDMQSSRWTLERPSASVLQHLATAAAAAAQRLASLQEHVEGAGDDWGTLFTAPLADFDAWVLLRRDALPHANRQLPGEAARLTRYMERHAPHAAGGARKRSRICLAAEPASKSSRAVLRAFPQRVLATQPTEALLPELLVGFDPVGRYLALLEGRFGHLAVFCADIAGGFPAVGIKWLPSAFVPGPIRPSLAHCVVEVGPGLVTPNLSQVLQEMHLMGEGLVQDVVAL